MIPRDLECWYCKNGQHERCALRHSCACYICCPLARREGDDNLSRQASHYTPA